MLPLTGLITALCVLQCAAAGKVCARPREIQSAVFRPGKVLYEPRDVVTYSCIPGYERESGNNKAVCLAFGNWDHSTLKCKPKQCPKPGPLDNGQIQGNELTYQSVIYFTCNKGFALRGANQSECLESGKWSHNAPVCEVVTCPEPPLPKSAQMTRDRPGGRNVSVYQDVVTYRCLQNRALIGNENVTCTENGTWTDVPECREVKCNRPPEIPHGFMSFAPYRKYNYKEFVSYGCNPPYALDGNRISFCDKDGEWSPKPACKAPCHVTTPKATILYNNGRKMRVDEISGQQILHGDTLTYFCKNKELKCAYPAPSQCRDGNFTVPACYKKPSFSLFSTDPSAMPPCAQ